MDFRVFELDGEQYPLTNPVDFLLEWALQSATDEFKSKESLDRIATILKAVCPDIPDRYFVVINNFTIPLIDIYQIVDFVSKLLVAVLDKRIKVIESLESESLSKQEIDQKINQFRQVADRLSKDFAGQRVNLIMGGVQITPVVSQSEDGKLATLKQQIEALSAEISLIEKS